ncbi:MAG: YwqG family protein [Xanthomonas sp.]
MKTSHAVAVSAAIGLGLVVLLAVLLLGGRWWVLRTLHGDTPKTATATAGTAADARAQATQALAPYQARLQATRRPVVHLHLQPMAQDDRLASKVGGRPYWTGDRPYPHAADGQPLALLAQIDLARVPPIQGYPRQGMLQFFIAGDDVYGANFGDARSDLAALSAQRNFRVVYWPQPKASARQAEVPLAAAEQLPFDPSRPRAMQFDAGEETIGSRDVRFEQALGTPLEAVAAAYASRHALPQDAVDDALYEVLSRGGHKLGGYPEFTQEDPRTPQDRQVLLLQLDSDEQMLWGDSGVANFFIDPDDLRRGDFSRVAYNWDCF